MLAMILGILFGLGGGIHAAPPEVAVVGLASVRLAEVWDSPHFKEARVFVDSKAARLNASVARETGLEPGAIERVTFVQFKVAAGEAEQTPSIAMVIVPRKPLDFAATVKVIQKPVGVAHGKVPDLPDFAILDGGGTDRIAVSGKAIVILPDMEPDDNRLAMEAAMIAKALQRDTERAGIMARDNLLATFAVDVRELARMLSYRFLDDGTIFELPDVFAPVLKGRVMAAKATLANSLALQGEIIFSTSADAAAAKPAIELVFKQVARLFSDAETNGESPQARTMIELKQIALRLLASARVTVKDRSVLVTVALSITPAAVNSMAAGILIAEDAAARALSQKKLSQIATASHNFFNECEAAPIANICDDRDKPLLSWRVRLLPYLNQKELYDQFKLDEPWDSEHNKKLIPRMPKVFVVPTAKQAKPGFTYYQTFVGKKGVGTRPMLQDGDPKGLSINGITDGISLTIMVAEASEAVEWTKPSDLLFDSDAKLPALGGHFIGGFNAAMGDGVARFFTTTIDEKRLKALITANGGEEVTLDDQD